MTLENVVAVSHYVTRERVHIDRIATAWAIRRFIDPSATFAFVERERDPQTLHGIAFDMRGSDLRHRDGKVTLEVLLERHGLRDAALQRMAAIVHVVDTLEGNAPEAAGVGAVFDGIRDGLATDDARMEVGFAVCDALYIHCGGVRPG